MAKIVICGDAVIITSTLKLDDIKFIQKYRKDALTLMGGEDGKDPIFKIAATDNGYGSINKYGAEFARATHDDQGYAVITTICKVDGDIKEFVADTIGSYVSKLNELESKLPEVLRQITSEREAIMNSITIAQ